VPLFLKVSFWLLSIFAFLLCTQSDLEKSIKRGKDVYEDFCINCHLADGKGVNGIFPPLAKADFLLNKREESIRAVKFGQSGKITVNGVEYNSNMAPMGLTDEEVMDVMNYILNSWGNKTDKMVTMEEVNGIKKR
jgi:mono/diheme cytochrome c family protein